MDTMQVLRNCRDVLEDVALELEQDEVAELTSYALDRKIAALQAQLEEILNEE